ncbi:hypothetical protein OM427_30275, partial [Halomonas sp. 18H]
RTGEVESRVAASRAQAQGHAVAAEASGIYTEKTQAERLGVFLWKNVAPLWRAGQAREFPWRVAESRPGHRQALT